MSAVCLFVLVLVVMGVCCCVCLRLLYYCRRFGFFSSLFNWLVSVGGSWLLY